MCFVFISVTIFAASSLCYSAVRLSITWCTSLFRYNHYLCVKSMRLLINFAPQISTDPHGLYQRSISLIEMISKYGIQPSTKQSHPRLSISIDMGTNIEVGCVQSTMDCHPWLSRYASIILANSEATFASPRMSMMVSIVLGSWSNRPRSLHCVRCFEFSCLYPHCGHLFMMFSSQSESFELQPHYPETCLVMNVQNVLG